MSIEVRRGDVVLVDLDGAVGAEMQNARVAGGGQHRPRPCLVVQNDAGNDRSPLTIIVTLTLSGVSDKDYPHVARVAAEEQGPGGKDCAIDCGQLRAIDQSRRIIKVLGYVLPEAMRRVDLALAASLGLRLVGDQHLQAGAPSASEPAAASKLPG